LDALLGLSGGCCRMTRESEAFSGVVVDQRAVPLRLPTSVTWRIDAVGCSHHSAGLRGLPQVRSKARCIAPTFAVTPPRTQRVASEPRTTDKANRDPLVHIRVPPLDATLPPLLAQSPSRLLPHTSGERSPARLTGRFWGRRPALGKVSMTTGCSRTRRTDGRTATPRRQALLISLPRP
jgi:hypothetical protein